ncbi:MAG: hypothetical protein LV479_09040 [Methylacidiphilales bacterium]|nr:hypothetical protein [Candidatus Methylacidiphilales bacterium]
MNTSDAIQKARSSILNEEAQDILSEAAKGIPSEIWRAIALAEQAEAPKPTPTYIYTSSGTMGI